MTLQEQCALSYYTPIAPLNEEHGVFLVQHTVSRQIFVRKTVPPYNAGVFRFLKDNPIPGTPFIYELYEEEDRITVIEEYISGRLLQEILDRDGPLDGKQTALIVRQLCGILERFHSLYPPLIHRDIKPSNIIISPEGKVTLLDMDAAKWYNERAGRDTKLIGTSGYAAPEQYGFGASNTQTDIYAVGVLINVLLTGQFPQEETVGGEWGKIVARCTKLAHEERFRSVGEIVRVLDDGSSAGTVSELSRDVSGAADRTWRSYLPPGFRSRSPSMIILAVLGYLILFWISMVVASRDEGGVVDWANRIDMGMLLLSIVFFNGNYRGIRQRLKVTEIKPAWLRIGFMIIIDLGIAAFWFLLLFVFEKGILGG